MIILTRKAIDKIKEISLSEGLDHTSVRVKVIGGGCAGFSHDMTFDNVPNDLDEKFNIEDIVILVDPLSMQYLDDIEIDYLDGPFSSGFKFNNGNAKSSCGCGNSFSI